MSRLGRCLLSIAIVWTLALMVLGAYVRLQDAGLGCPDWPGCYGHFTVPDEHHEISHAQDRFGVPVDVAKGWKEMIHRYVASGLGLLIIALTLVLWRDRRRAGLNPAWALVPLGLVVLQGLFGMWTVTLKLMPAVVTAHLIGGMSILLLLIYLYPASDPAWRLSVGLRRYWLVVLGLVGVQIILGGWVSTNYAALACNGFPQCQGSWTLPAGALEALRPDRELGYLADGRMIEVSHLAAIHYLHRLGAVFVLLGVGFLSYQLRSVAPRFAALLLAVLVVQIGLGIANVILHLPLALALAHHAGAAILLASLIAGFRRAKFSQTPPQPLYASRGLT
jgi:cytochrome c oxidase assembly protein subunit 15